MGTPTAATGAGLDWLGILLGIVDTALRSIIFPLLVAYGVTIWRIGEQKKKERRQKEQDWFKKTASICQLILWEMEHLDDTKTIDDRADGISLTTLSSAENSKLKFLDEKFLELLNHGTNAPTGIPEEVDTLLRKVVFSYVNPDQDSPTSELTLGSHREGIRGDIEKLEEKSRELGSSRNSS